MRQLATTVARAWRAANVPTRLRRRFVAPETAALRWASTCAELVAAANVAHMSDSNLKSELRALGAVPDVLTDAPTLARALAIVSTSMQRRLGAWRVFETDDLPAPINNCLETAESIAESTWHASRTEDPVDLDFADSTEFLHELERRLDRHRLNANQRELVYWLAYAGVKRRLAQPEEISLPSTFYDALRQLDTDGSMRFDPTREQIMTAALLVRGLIVEMDAGEGKTVSAGLAAAVTAATGRTVHILTANDYLALRDTDWLAPVYESLDIDVEAVLSSMDDEERLHAYAHQIVYTTAREVGFDYLRDNLKLPPEYPVRGRLDAAIVDEADHVLIDQNQTPLIISGAETGDINGFHRVHQAVRELVRLHASEVARVADVVSKAGDGAPKADLDAELATLYAADPDNPVLRQVAARSGIGRQHLIATLDDIEELVDSHVSYAYEQRFFLIHDPRTRSIRFTDRGEADIAGKFGSAAGSTDSPSPERHRHEAMFSLAHQFLRAYALFKREVDYVVVDEQVVLVDQLNGRLLPDNRYMHGLQAALEAKEGLPQRPEYETLAQTTVTGLMGLYPRISGLTGTAVEARDEFMRDYGLHTVRVTPSHPPRREDHAPRVFPTTERQQKAVVQEVQHWHSLGRPVLVGTASVQQSEEIGRLLSRAGIRHNLLNAVNSENEARIVRDAGRFGAVTVATNMAGRGTDIVLEPGLDQQILGACRRLIEDVVSEREATRIELRCDNREEAALVGAALSGIGGTTVSLADGSNDTSVLVVPERVEGHPTSLEFGLGLCVLGTALNPTSRVDRQLRGRAGRQGAFGASKLLVSAQDNPIAFSRQATSLPGVEALAPTRVGRHKLAQVARLVGEVQSEREADDNAASALYRDYSAVLETQTTEYYRARRQVFHYDEWFDRCVGMAGRWADGLVKQTFDQWGESDYVSAFEDLSDRLWGDLAIDCGPLFGAGRVVLSTELGVMLTRRLDEARSSEERFEELSKLALVTAADELWPGLLSHLRDVALSNAIYGPTHRSAVAHFTRQAHGAYEEFISSAWSQALPSLLTLHFQERLLSGPDTVIPVQEEILSILA